jgi:hypothetical protein
VNAPFVTAVFIVVDNDVNKLIGSLANVLYLPFNGIEVFVVAIKLKDNILNWFNFWSLKIDELTKVTKSILMFIELAVAIITLCWAFESKKFVWTLDSVRSVVNDMIGVIVSTNVGANVSTNVGANVSINVGMYVGVNDVGIAVLKFNVGSDVGTNDFN